MVDLQDGNNEDGDNYCVKKIDDEYIRLKEYKAGTHASSSFVSSGNRTSGALAMTGENMYLVRGDSTVSMLSQKCALAKEVVLPDSIRYLEDGFLISLELDAGVIGETSGGNFADCTYDVNNYPPYSCKPGVRQASFNIFVGEKLQQTSSYPELSEDSNWVSDHSTAQIWRRCPTMTEFRSDMPEFPFGDAIPNMFKKTMPNIYRHRFMPVVYGKSYKSGMSGVTGIADPVALRSAYGPAGASQTQFSCFCTHNCNQAGGYGFGDFKIAKECAITDGSAINEITCACGDTVCNSDSFACQQNTSYCQKCSINKGVGTCST